MTDSNVDGGGSSAARAPDCDSGDGGSIPLRHTTQPDERESLATALFKARCRAMATTDAKPSASERRYDLMMADAALAHLAKSAGARHRYKNRVVDVDACAKPDAGSVRPDAPAQIVEVTGQELGEAYWNDEDQKHSLWATASSVTRAAWNASAARLNARLRARADHFRNATKKVPPDRAKLADVLRVACATYIDSGSPSLGERLADAALTHLAESAPVRLVVPAAVKEFVDSFEESKTFFTTIRVTDETGRMFNLHARWKAACAAIDSLDAPPSISRAAVPRSVWLVLERAGVPTVDQRELRHAASDARRELAALDSGSSVLVEHHRAVLLETLEGAITRATSQEKPVPEVHFSVLTREGQYVGVRVAMARDSERDERVLVERGELERLKKDAKFTADWRADTGGGALLGRLEAAERRASDAEARAASLQDMNERYLAAQAELERIRGVLRSLPKAP